VPSVWKGFWRDGARNWKIDRKRRSRLFCFEIARAGTGGADVIDGRPRLEECLIFPRNNALINKFTTEDNHANGLPGQRNLCGNKEQDDATHRGRAR